MTRTAGAEFDLITAAGRSGRLLGWSVDKSRMTTILAGGVAAIGVAMGGGGGEILAGTGLFAFSGALTNWVAIHMLFEKVPGLYGSGVVQARFEEIRTEIRNLVLEEFFDEAHVREVLKKASGAGGDTSLDLSGVAEAVDTEKAWESLVEIVMGSPLGGALGMLGGQKALDPLREPFEARMRSFVAEMGESESVQAAMGGVATGGDTVDRVRSEVTRIVDERIKELTPGRVKAIVQRMIHEYLGWLVVWGGVFGGLIGAAASILKIG